MGHVFMTLSLLFFSSLFSHDSLKIELFHSLQVMTPVYTFFFINIGVDISVGTEAVLLLGHNARSVRGHNTSLVCGHKAILSLGHKAILLFGHKAILSLGQDTSIGVWTQSSYWLLGYG